MAHDEHDCRNDGNLDTLQELLARSDLKERLFSNLPRDPLANVVQTMRYTVTTEEQTKQINDLQNALLENVKNGSDFEWKDSSKLKSKFQCGTAFDFDMYLRFEEMEGSETVHTVQDLLGTVGEHLEIIVGTKNQEEYRQTPIINKTWLWVEICTNPLMARQELYHLFRAHMVLKPDDDTKIMAVICLNQDWDTTAAVADHLRNNSFVQDRARQCHMELAIIWTNRRNLSASMCHIYAPMRNIDASMPRVEKGMEELKEGQAKLEVGQAKLEVGQTKLEQELRNMSALLQKLLDQAPQLEPQQEPQQPPPPTRPHPRRPLHFVFRTLLNRNRGRRENHGEEF